MDYEQKYTEDEKPYELDEEFVIQIRTVPYDILVKIVSMLHDNAEYLLGSNDEYMQVGGNVKGKDPFFFKIGYVFDYSTIPILVNFEEITCDDYLDFILADSYLIDLN
jgi:hypothetical protein